MARTVRLVPDPLQIADPDCPADERQSCTAMLSQLLPHPGTTDPSKSKVTAGQLTYDPRKQLSILVVRHLLTFGQLAARVASNVECSQHNEAPDLPGV